MTDNNDILKQLRSGMFAGLTFKNVTLGHAKTSAHQPHQ